MGIFLVSLLLGVPCTIFLIYCATPKGREWMKRNNLL